MITLHPPIYNNGSTVCGRMTFKNNSSTSATGVVVNVTVPPELTVNNGWFTSKGSYNGSNEWVIGILGPQEEVYLDVCFVLTDATALPLEVKGVISAVNCDINESNNTYCIKIDGLTCEDVAECGFITEITSVDGSITVTQTGPNSIDLSQTELDWHLEQSTEVGPNGEVCFRMIDRANGDALVGTDPLFCIPIPNTIISPNGTVDIVLNGTTFEVEVPISADADNLLSLGSDNKHYLDAQDVHDAIASADLNCANLGL